LQPKAHVDFAIEFDRFERYALSAHCLSHIGFEAIEICLHPYWVKRRGHWIAMLANQHDVRYRETEGGKSRGDRAERHYHFRYPYFGGICSAMRRSRAAEGIHRKHPWVITCLKYNFPKQIPGLRILHSVDCGSRLFYRQAKRFGDACAYRLNREILSDRA
jgi:hypothetical protein